MSTDGQGGRTKGQAGQAKDSQEVIKQVQGPDPPFQLSSPGTWGIRRLPWSTVPDTGGNPWKRYPFGAG